MADVFDDAALEAERRGGSEAEIEVSEEFDRDRIFRTGLPYWLEDPKANPDVGAAIAQDLVNNTIQRGYW